MFRKLELMPVATRRAPRPRAEQTQLAPEGDWLGSPAESPLHRRAYELFALLLVVGFFGFTHLFWAPAHGGVDQNGYLVGGKMFAQRFSTRLDLVNPITHQFDPYQFVGLMWIGTDLGTSQERYYPKYPVGLPILVAAALKLGGPTYGPVLTYYINPVSMSLAVLATFLLTRLVAGSFAAIMAMIVFATSPVTLGLTNDPNSHASATFCAAMGMFLLLRWWQAGGWIRAFAAGFLLGYAASVRYTEATLIIPAALVVLFRLWPELAPFLRWCCRRLLHDSSVLADAFHARRLLPEQVGHGIRLWLGTNGELEPAPAAWCARFARGKWAQATLLLAGWALPVGFLALHNWIGFRSLTGYDPTNESAGFAWDYFRVNWETMLRQLNANGMFFLFPLGIAGMLWLFGRHWRLALVLAAWIVPNQLIYAFYYWAPDGTHIGYLRFFLTIFPALAMCGFWLLYQVGQSLLASSRPILRALLTPVAMGIVTALSFLVGLETALPMLDGLQRQMSQLYRTTMEVQGFGSGNCRIPPAVPAGSVLFAPQYTLHHLQFVGDYLCYDSDLFNEYRVRSLKKIEPEEPQYLQPQRAKLIYERLKFFGDRELIEEEKKLVLTALDHGRRVFYLVPRNALPATALRFSPTRLGASDSLKIEMVKGAIWNDPMTAMAPKPTRPTPRRQPARPPVEDPRSSTWCILEITRRTELPPTAVPAIRQATEILKSGK